MKTEAMASEYFMFSWEVKCFYTSTLRILLKSGYFEDPQKHPMLYRFKPLEGPWGFSGYILGDGQSFDKNMDATPLFSTPGLLRGGGESKGNLQGGPLTSDT